ncbi:MAG: hypothetical protein JSS90_02885 [Bacteroidetes bacterium]|nr:hypothetical protein [Bacteroidota bacterium]
MNKSIYAIAISLLASGYVNAQELKEVVQPLSSKAVKGYMYDTRKGDDGSLFITYKMKLDKKSDNITYEEYGFDKSLNFTGSKEVQENKVDKPDFEKTYYYATVGGTNSFDVLSMKLKLNKVVQLKTWNYEKQRYITKKTISRDVIKPRNDDGKVYLGYSTYSSEDKPDVLTIAKADAKDKAQSDKFCIVMFNNNLDLTEKPIDLNGKYSLVFSDQLSNEDVVAIFAPVKGAADVSKYVYFRFDIEGNQKSRIEYSSPASAMFITASYDKNDNVYFFGSSGDSKESFERVYSEYAPIYNPGYTEGGENKLDAKWKKHLNEKMDKIHLLEFSTNALVFASSTPVSEFKAKFKPASGEKGAKAYNGKRFAINNFYVTPGGEYLAAGQLIDDGNFSDIVCFHFDSKGNLKAQYGVNKMNTDKKSEVFRTIQNFYVTSDNNLCWELLEVKGVKGYESFFAAYNGEATFYPLYFPRVAKIDLNATTVTAFKTMGNEKYFLRRDFLPTYDEKDKSVTYYGHDEDYKKLWVGKMMIP